MISGGQPGTLAGRLLLLLQLTAPLPVAAVDSPLPSILICYNYDCNRTALVQPSAGEWQTVVDQFKPPARSPTVEREMIRRAIAVLEYIAGTQSPTFRDRGRNPVIDDWPGQMDCIDESINTSRYLDLLQERGLLHWHRTAGRAYRAPYLFDPHWGGLIVELATLERYVVDSWYLDNGEPPYIQALNEWLRKDPIHPQ
jgi:hypothetical protein